MCVRVPAHTPLQVAPIHDGQGRARLLVGVQVGKAEARARTVWAGLHSPAGQ